jgi:outer membrane protein OmpA-like peptidoglycan-associated protein
MTGLRQLLTVTAAFAALSLGQAHASDSVTINYGALNKLPPKSAARSAAVPKLIPPSMVRKHMAAVRAAVGPSNHPSDGDTSVPPVFDSTHSLYNAVESTSNAGNAAKRVAAVPAVGPAPAPAKTASAAPPPPARPSTIAPSAIAPSSVTPTIAPAATIAAAEAMAASPPNDPPAIAAASPGEQQMAMLTPAPAVTPGPAYAPVPAASAYAPRFTDTALPRASWDNAQNVGEVVFKTGRGAELVDLDQATLQKLDQLAKRICNDGKRVMLEAFGGARGDKSHEAHRIALRRGLAVRRYLIARGVPSSWIDILAVGGAKAGPLNRVDVMLASS